MRRLVRLDRLSLAAFALAQSWVCREKFHVAATFLCGSVKRLTLIGHSGS